MTHQGYVSEIRNMFCCFSKDDTESRKAFRSMFPDAPTSSETLEAQQDALLRHQEDTLKSMKETSKYRLLLSVFGCIHFPCLLYTIVNIYFVSTACLCTNICISCVFLQ